MAGDGWALPFAFVVVGLLALLLRWAFAHGSSVVARPVRPGARDDYGLLIDVATPRDLEEADLVRTLLAAHGIRATSAVTLDGPRVYVREEDEERARRYLAS